MGHLISWPVSVCLGLGVLAVAGVDFSAWRSGLVLTAVYWTVAVIAATANRPGQPLRRQHIDRRGPLDSLAEAPTDGAAECDGCPRGWYESWKRSHL